MLNNLQKGFGGVVDDYCYLNGVSVPKPDWTIPYCLVVGKKGIGKSAYSMIMSSYHKDVQYISAQSLDQIHRTFRAHANKIIHIGEVTFND